MTEEDQTATGGEGATAAPDTSATDKFERRLNDLASAMTSMQQSQRQREARSQIASQEAKVARDVQEAQRAVDTAEKDLANATEDGDSQAIAKAQRKLSESIADRERKTNIQDNFRQQIRQMEQRQGGSTGTPGANDAQQPPGDQKLDTTNLEDWKSRNSSWYGVDDEMTKAAHEINQKIRDAGVIPVGSREYFKAIDNQMRQRYPHKFNSAPATESGRQGTSQSSGRSSDGHIPQSVVDGWAAMGIDVNDDKVLQGMVEKRKKLVDKGILPESPAYGRINESPHTRRM
jgi:hypothetical protein